MARERISIGEARQPMNANFDSSGEDWRSILAQRMAQFGHRNWVVVADSAYPLQSNPGIETIVTGASHLEILRAALDAIAQNNHLQADVFIDSELKAVPETDAPGVTELRAELHRLLQDIDPCELDHEQIIGKLDESGALFRILILKSTLSIPYTSVFLRLGCGYWSTDAEQRLRQSLANQDSRHLRR